MAYGKTDNKFQTSMKIMRPHRVSSSIVESWHDKKLRIKLAKAPICQRCGDTLRKNSKRFKYCYPCNRKLKQINQSQIVQ